MNSATNEQPVAGHGNGSVRTQNQPSCSPSESSSQSSYSPWTTTDCSSKEICPRSIAEQGSGGAVDRPRPGQADGSAAGHRVGPQGSSRTGVIGGPCRGSP